jgi:hypothetical protein
VVRVGIPVAVTLALGYWLEKKLQPAKEQKERPALELTRRERSNKIIQLHCWDLKHCESAKRAQCAAYQHPELPCWLALQVDGSKVRQGCFTCGLYNAHSAAA